MLVRKGQWRFLLNVNVIIEESGNRLVVADIDEKRIIEVL